MFRNYITVALRSLSRSLTHSVINIAGLSVGICCCILIILFVRDELTFDRFHKNADRIYRVYAIEDWGDNQRFIDMTTPFPMGPALKSNLEEIELMVRIHSIGTQAKSSTEQFSESVTITGGDFLKMFDFNILSGNGETALLESTSIILTESAATRFFGETDPIGKPLSLLLNDQFEDFTVGAVIQDSPTNSSIQFSIIISDLNYPKLYSERLLTSAWFNILPETYVQLKEGVSPEAVAAKFPSVFKPLLGEDYEKSKYFVGLQPLTAIHLDTSLPPGIAPVSDPRYSFILGGVALLILVVACINFITLSVGRSLKRSKEVGIRKVAGAKRSQLVIQYIGEAILITMIALALGVALAGLCLPLFNDLSGKQLLLEVNGFFLLVCICLIAVIGAFAGSYPAFILSAFKPATVLKGVVRSGNNRQPLRKVLVGVQLTLSIFLISSTLLMKQQLQFLQEKNLGFNKEQLVVVQMNVPSAGLVERVNEGFKRIENLKVEMAEIPEIIAVCGSSQGFAKGDWINIGYTDDGGVYRTFKYNTVDEDYVGTLKIDFVAGRNFSDDIPSDARRSIIVNEAFVRSMGWTDAVGRKIPGKKFADHEIVGVVKDFHYSSLYTKVEPLVLAMNPSVIADGIENININESPVPKLLIRIAAGDVGHTISRVEEVWDKLTGHEEFSFSFVDQALAHQYQSDRNLGSIIMIATVIALIIGCMGLYGLASLAMQNRTKEISIRKVLGASHRSILVLLSRDYIYLIIASLIFSIPLTWYLMQDWLMSFEYRIAIGIDVFVMAGALCLGVALLTISVEAFKTAGRQPADTLKYE